MIHQRGNTLVEMPTKRKHLRNGRTSSKVNSHHIQLNQEGVHNLSAIITAGATGATGNTTTLEAGATVIVSGVFGGATVCIFVDADALREAPAYTFMAPGGMKLQVASGTTVTATVVGGQVGTSIDVSVI